MLFYCFLLYVAHHAPAKGIMKKRVVTGALVLVLVWTMSLGLLACAAPPHQGLEAYYEVSLIESAQTQQRVHVRANAAACACSRPFH